MMLGTRKAKEDEDWHAFAYCQAWCAKDGILEINPFKRLHHFMGVPKSRWPVGPLLTVVGVIGPDVVVSPNMKQVTRFRKDKVRILTERPRD